MKASDVGFTRFFLRITACHMVTYMVIGLLAFLTMDYATAHSAEGSSMVPTDSVRVSLGPALQVIRGVIFAIVLYPFRRVFLDENHGWLKLWGLFMGLAILSTAGPAPGSVEGMIYTKYPIVGQIFGLWEVVLQTLIMSVLVVLWHRKPTSAWNIVMGILTALVFLLSIASVFAPQPEAFKPKTEATSTVSPGNGQADITLTRG
jgi:hypothetical protein